jgi:MFS family permease
MSSPSSIATPRFRADRDLHRVLWLTLALFLSYLCVAISLPVTSVYVTTQLGFGNALAGLAVGISFASTIATRGWAGRMADHQGSKSCMVRGLWVYALSGLVCGAASWSGFSPAVAYGVLIIGRLLLGVGESLTVVGLIAWCFGVMGRNARGRCSSWWAWGFMRRLPSAALLGSRCSTGSASRG